MSDYTEQDLDVLRFAVPLATRSAAGRVKICGAPAVKDPLLDDPQPTDS